MTEPTPDARPAAPVDTDPPTSPVPAQSGWAVDTPTASAEPDHQVPAPRGSAAHPGGRAAVSRTRVSGTWVAVIIAVVVLVFLLIFILQNLARTTVYLFGTSASLPIGIAVLLAAVGGALLVSLIGTARILQLRRTTKKLRRTR